MTVNDYKRVVSVILIFSFILMVSGQNVLALEQPTASLTVSNDVVHSGAKYTLSVELSSPASKEIRAEIADGDKTIAVTVPMGQTVGKTELTATSYSGNLDRSKAKTYTLNSGDGYVTTGNSKVMVAVLPKPNFTFNADFLMVNAGKKLKINFRCKNAGSMSVSLPISLRTADGTVIDKYTLDKSHSAFQHTLTVPRDWKFPYYVSVYNELTGTECKKIPVMVIDNDKPGIRRVDTTEKKIALGFDCGYNNKFTDYILDTLDEYNAHATFFVTGHFVKKFSPMLSKIVSRGHEIGNHTMSHNNLNNMAPMEAYQEIEGVNKAVYENTGIRPRILRPPYGACNPSSVAISRMTGCETVFWTMDSYDWDPKRSAKEIIERSTKNMGEGCILLFHNSAPKTKKTLKTILDDYKSKGLQIVSISELLYQGNYTVDKDGLQKPDPNYQQITASELLNGLNLTINVTGASAQGQAVPLHLTPSFMDDTPVYRSKTDIEKIKSNPQIMEIKTDCGDSIAAPVKAGNIVGKAEFYYEGKLWFTADLMAASDVATVSAGDIDLPASHSDMPSESRDYKNIVLFNTVIVLIVAAVALLINRKKI